VLQSGPASREPEQQAELAIEDCACLPQLSTCQPQASATSSAPADLAPRCRAPCRRTSWGIAAVAAIAFSKIVDDATWPRALGPDRPPRGCVFPELDDDGAQGADQIDRVRRCMRPNMFFSTPLVRERNASCRRPPRLGYARRDQSAPGTRGRAHSSPARGRSDGSSPRSSVRVARTWRRSARGRARTGRRGGPAAEEGGADNEALALITPLGSGSGSGSGLSLGSGSGSGLSLGSGSGSGCGFGLPPAGSRLRELRPGASGLRPRDRRFGGQRSAIGGRSAIGWQQTIGVRRPRDRRCPIGGRGRGPESDGRG